MHKKLYTYIICILFLSACKSPVDNLSLFSLLDNDTIGIDFINQLDYTEELNTYTFRNFYNGGGVALGDINNDGLIDIFLSGNLVNNKLYLNKGNWIFEDISKMAGIESEGAWSMGASMADINGDGLLDIYVCKSGPPEGPNRNNSLYINQGNLSFTDKSHEFKVADEGLSTHAAFFDYDKDGDLDFYLLNNSIKSVGAYDFRPGQRDKPDSLGGNKLYRNDGDYFTDVSHEAGIFTSAIGFGLGVTVGDLDQDGWQDMYISNDYFEKDYLYLNNRDGTFSESLEDHIREISLSSMGADMADLNNDSYPEIFVTDMLPSTDARIKTKTTFDSWDKYEVQLKNGYYRQFTRNALQLNNGDGSFSEVSRMAGVEATDWSWGALIFDMDNNGLKDIFVANGIYKDLIDQDYINFIGDPKTVREILKRENKVIKRLIDSIPSEPIANCAFENKGKMSFVDKAETWGLGKPSFSNGSAYGDIDNDGDLDLVVNNVNMPPFIYKSNATQLFPEHHYISLSLVGSKKNTSAFGAKVRLYIGDQLLYQEQMPMRSYQSTTDSRIHFGIGNNQSIDSIVITWPDLFQTKLSSVPIDTTIEIVYENSVRTLVQNNFTNSPANLKFDYPESDLGLNYRHIENDFIDFDRDRMIPHMLSNEGPCSCIGDINNDGKPDIYLGGSKDHPGSIYMQTANGFIKKKSSVIYRDKISEDTDCRFFDADNDGFLDLYVCSGGNEFPSTSSALLDRLYINDKEGNFKKSNQLLPIPKYISSACVRPSDIDKDGDLDLFVGSRLNPFAYGTLPDSYLLINDGSGNFTNSNITLASTLKKLGMVKDAIWSDIDNDNDDDLLIIGEWMSIKCFVNESGKLVDKTSINLPQNINGLWNCIASLDIYNDGFPDFVVGNLGLNSRISASPDKPASMYVNDFDRNGTIEQIICTYNEDESYPINLRQDLVMQIPQLKNKYLKFKNYKEQTINDIFNQEQVNESINHTINNLQSSLLINNGDGTFEIKALDEKAQVSPIYAIECADYDKDGMDDIVIGGNFYKSKPEIGIYDASYGLYFSGQKEELPKVLDSKKSGIKIKGEIRQINKINLGVKEYILFVKNDEKIEILENKSHYNQ